MTSKERKKITANELYLNECMSILYTKIKATGLNVFDEDGTPSSKYIVNVENYAHGTVTYIVSPKSIKVNYDGTNFSPRFQMDEENGRFMYRLKPLGMEYLSCDRPLDDAVHEKKVMITIGNSTEYYRYLACGTFFILLEYCSKGEEGRTMIINEIASKYSDKELIQYLYEAQSMALDREGDVFGDGNELSEDELKIAEEMFSPSDIESISKIVSKSLSEKEQEEIEVYSSDDEYKDIYDIDYSLADILKDKLTDEPYQSDYPSNIEDFDYQEYMRAITNRDGETEERVVNITGPEEDVDEASEYDDDNADYDEYNDDEEIDETSASDLYSETDTITDGEGFIEDSIYTITRDDEEINGQLKCDILDEAVEGIMDVDQQITCLKDYYGDIYTELRKIREIIIRRKERVTHRKDGQGGADVGDSGAGDDIENR